MTDDERLAALFRDAASDADAPPPGFGHDDVVAASRRITVRRRSAAVAAAVAVGLAGMGAAIVLPLDDVGSPGSAAAPLNAPGSAEDTVGEPADRDEEAAPPVVAAPQQPLGPGTTTCAERQDPALRALVEQVLPEIVAARAAASPDICLPGTERYLLLEVADAGVPGVLSVAYLPPGTTPQLVPGALSAPTASGGTVIVGTSPDVAGAGAPFVDRLPALLEFLAPRL